MFRFFRNRSRDAVVDRLHEHVAAASRRPEFYGSLGVRDTIEGRFEMLALHLVLVLRALRRLPAPAEDVAQDLVDAFFRTMDASLRETGIGDAGVPRRIKSLAQSFYGRARAYDAGLDDHDSDELGEALSRNVFGGSRSGDDLAAYALACDRALATAGLADLLSSGPPFPSPLVPRFETEARP